MFKDYKPASHHINTDFKLIREKRIITSMKAFYNLLPSVFAQIIAK